MDTHIRWKVKRRIRDVQVTLAVILLFVTTQASSGKSARKKKKERKKMRDCVVCAWSWEKFSPPPPKTHLCAFFFIGALNIFSLVFPKLWETIVKVSKSVCEFFFPREKKKFSFGHFCFFFFLESWSAKKKQPKKHPITDTCRPECVILKMLHV